MEGTFEYITVTPDSKAFTDVNEIYLEAFPAHERGSLNEMMICKNYYPGSSITAVYEDGKCVSFFHLIEQEKFIYGAYFAVSAEKRGQGYGTKILQAMLDHCNGKPFLGEAEYPSKDADNYEQRVKRIRFYERNGVHNTGEIVEFEKYGKYVIISSTKEPPIQEFRDFLAKLTKLSEEYAASQGE